MSTTVNTSELGAIDPDMKKKLEETIRAALRQKQEIDDIRGAIKDLVKNVAEELNLKPKMLNKAISLAYKNSLADAKAEMDTVEDILDVTGYA